MTANYYMTNFEKFGAYPAAFMLNFLKHTNFFPFWWISEELCPFFFRSHFFFVHPVYYNTIIYYFRYCRSSNIRKDANNKNIKVIFKSDRKTSGTGAQCNIKCIDPWPTTTTTSTTSTTTTTTTTISFTGWVSLKLCNYKLQV